MIEPKKTKFAKKLRKPFDEFASRLPMPKINPNIVKRLPNKIVASYINISNETLSRIKSKI